MLRTSGLQRATQLSWPCSLLPLRAAVECADMVLQHAAVVLKQSRLLTKGLRALVVEFRCVVRAEMPPLPALCESLLPMKDTPWTPILRAQRGDSVFMR